MPMHKYPSLPYGYEICEEVNEVKRFKKANIFLHGLAVKVQGGGEIVTGSSAGLMNTKELKEKAYFELIERISTLRNSKHIKEKNWSLSRSNGVAIYTNLKIAKEKALEELIERDRILRSWYQNIKPQKLSLDEHSYLESKISLLPEFEFKFYLFTPSKSDKYQNIFVTAALAEHPKHSSYFLGFGAGQSLEKSLWKSMEELIQRIGFLFGEKFTKPDKIYPSPLFHQDYFMQPEGKVSLEKWLSGENDFQLDLSLNLANETIGYEDLTPPELKSQYAVVKAKSDKRLNLYFGHSYPLTGQLVITNKEMAIHPIP